ncbi:MAG: hypothetical protein WBV94_31905 [Blastocatellia bacterium]
MWERRVILKNSNSSIIEVYDPLKRLEPKSTTGYALNMCNIMPDVDGMINCARTMRKLAHGYEALNKLWDKMFPTIKYALQEAQRLADEITEQARPVLASQAKAERITGKTGKRRARSNISFDALAKKIGKGKQTLLDVDKSLLFYEQLGLRRRLEEIAEQEREAVRRDRDSLKSLKGS